MTDDLRAQFIRFSVQSGVLRFGEFRTKAGRLSPYFFNAGLFHDGASLGRLAEFYAGTLLAARAGGLRFDMLFGPAYKGIALASSTAVALAQQGLNLPFAFNRKEAKDHGEGGSVIGAPLAGRIVIVDDVISAGTSVRESVELIRAHGAEPAAVLIALDRQERSGDAERVGEHSAAQDVTRLYGIPVLSIANLTDLLVFLDNTADNKDVAAHRERVAAYRSRYGVKGKD
ncbi:MAG: orotate phosphoribosyltransferase [Burkholderiaceae bacterium]